MPSDRERYRQLNGCHVRRLMAKSVMWTTCWSTKTVEHPPCVLDTSNWIGGRAVVVSPRVLKASTCPIGW